jgi:hypothetical protein
LKISKEIPVLSVRHIRMSSVCDRQLIHTAPQINLRHFGVCASPLHAVHTQRGCPRRLANTATGRVIKAIAANTGMRRWSCLRPSLSAVRQPQQRRQPCYGEHTACVHALAAARHLLVYTCMRCRCATSTQPAERAHCMRCCANAKASNSLAPPPKCIKKRNRTIYLATRDANSCGRSRSLIK